MGATPALFCCIYYLTNWKTSVADLNFTKQLIGGIYLCLRKFSGFSESIEGSLYVGLFLTFQLGKVET